MISTSILNLGSEPLLAIKFNEVLNILVENQAFDIGYVGLLLSS